MSLKHIDGFDQLRGQVGAALLSSLSGMGYNVTANLAMADSRKAGGNSLELRVAAGASGSSWSSRTNNVTQDLHGVAASANGRFVAVGDAGAAVYSDDNVTWLPLVLGVSANMKSIKNHASTWMAVGDNGTILRSTDGRNFAPRTSPILAANLRDVAWGGNVWVAVGTNGTAGVVFVSTDDGMNWSQVAIAATGGLNCVEHSGVNWVIGGNGGVVLTSPDAATWTTRSIGAGSVTVSDVKFGTAGRWLAAAGNGIYRSSDGGTSWTVAAAAVIANGNITALAELEGRWIAVAPLGQVRLSDDEVTWSTPAFAGASTTTLNDVAAARGLQVGYAIVGALNVAQPVESRRALIYISLAPPTTVSRTFTTTGNKVVIGFAHRASSRGRILSITDVLDMDWSAGISIGGEDGVAIPARNVWYYYELEIDKVALTVSLYINNTLDLTAPIPAGVAAQTAFEITWLAENGAIARIDDMYFLDETAVNGETLISRLGPIQVPLRLPTADAAPSEWSPASGALHWPQVGLLPPSSESFIRSATSGKQDMFTSSTALPEGAGTVAAPIIAVGVIVLAQKGDIDNRQLGLAVGTGVGQLEVIDTSLSVVPEYSVGIFEKAPGNVAWDAASVLSTPFGVIVRP